MKFKSQQGVALVVTLVMLSVITFLTIAFLTLARRDRAAVTVSLSQTDARYMADAALARAQAEAIAGIMARSNRLRYDLMVSRNIDVIDTTNPNTVLNSIANDLLHDPRPPVFIDTNTFQVANAVPEFRFYLDFDRNGQFETNGWLPVLNELGQPIGITNFFVGDLEWIGVLERPEYPHSATNRFIGRYAFIVLPAGKTLDLNYIHNQAKRRGIAADGYLRNQGVGSWELNLAAFLQELNTNVWVNLPPVKDYVYDPSLTFSSSGAAFEDALAILRFRYGGDYNKLDSANAFFGATPLPFASLGFDAYADGPIVTNHLSIFSVPVPANQLLDFPAQPWSGSDNELKFYDVQELFDRTKVSTNFVNRLQQASRGASSYDRYTFYRMLSQIGLETGNEDKGKIHLNYDNLVQLNTNGIASQTNFLAWRPVDFFQQTADKLLNRYRANLPNEVVSVSPLSVTNLLFYIQPGSNTNLPNSGVLLYTPEIHRLLQMAANIYDATHSNAFPTVFRPQFRSDGSSNFISGYVEETGINFLNSNWTNYNATSLAADINVYRIPLVIGAKKHLPNFNEFSLETIVEITRKLEVRKGTTNGPPILTNQMYLLSISNVFGIEAWNSYFTNHTRPMEIRVHHNYEGVITNELGVSLLSSSINSPVLSKPINNWPGARAGWQFTNSFEIPYLSGHFFLANSQYHQTPPYFRPVPTNAVGSSFDSPSGFPNPTWDLVLTNKIRYALIDTTSQRILDFIHISDLITHFSISSNLYGTPFPGEQVLASNFWDTNRIGGSADVMVPTRGVQSQIALSLGRPAIDASVWDAFSSQGPSGPQKDREIAAFQKFMRLTPSPPYQDVAMPTNLVMQAPFNPTRKLYFRQAWQANDPLVHYTLDDLVDPSRPPIPQPVVPPSKTYTNFSESNLGKLNDRYEPWGGKREPGGSPLNTSGSFQDYYYGIKDPGMRWSDDWDFPTNKFPNIGWLGRVHRGTPWQTIYLKNEVAPENTWRNWTQNWDGHPTNDWRLVDLFTTALNENASRGQLSVNQTNYAAWSAVLSGVVVLENPTSHVFIEPDSDELRSIVDALDALRQEQPGQVFERVGDILASTNLTVNSPFIEPGYSLLDPDYPLVRDAATDAMYERIPQQILSLLRVGEPRLLIYAYGQSLKPADRSLVMGGQYFNVSTNYQITGEVATRTVLRIDGAPRNPRAVIESYNLLYAD
jgi:hypothetical protein